MDPRFRTLYPSLEAAGAPPVSKPDGFWIAVEVGNDWVQDYVSHKGKWAVYGRPYLLATAD